MAVLIEGPHGQADLPTCRVQVSAEHSQQVFELGELTTQWQLSTILWWLALASLVP